MLSAITRYQVYELYDIHGRNNIMAYMYIWPAKCVNFISHSALAVFAQLT